MAISKTDFIRGLQCPKMMWLDKHKPQEKSIPPEIQQKLDEGNDFGDGAMGIFGEYVETTAYREDGRLDYAKMIKTTAQLIEECVPVICEASFSYYGNFCSADILRRGEKGFEMYEVKNSSAVKTVFLQDVAFQKYIMKKCGVEVKRACLILNGGEENPYLITDVTREIYPFERLAYSKVWELSKVKNQKEEPQAEPGERCFNPYECWYREYCLKNN